MNKISDAIRLRKKRQWFKDMFFIFLGTLTYSFGYTAFVLPEKVVMGGVAGISALLYYAFGLLPGISIWVLNITLLLVAMKALSRQFIVRTVIGVTMLSALIGALQPVFQMFPMITAGEDKFMHVLIGGALGGAGLGLVFSHNGSTGGTDIIIALLNKKFSMSFGRAMQFIDITIISSSYLLFRSMETIVYGICLIYTGADPMGGFKSTYTEMGSGTTLGLPNLFFFALIVGAFIWFLYNKTRHGKFMYAIGGNESAASVAGVNVPATLIRIYFLAAMLYGLAGFLTGAKTGGASVQTGYGYELEAIAACTIGGVSTNGGVGKVSGILIGVLVFEILKICLQFLGVDPSYTFIVQGLVIIVAVALDLRKYLAKK